MSCVLNRQRASGSGAQGGGAGYVIENSLRFNELDSAQLNFTNSSAPTDASKGIVGCWIKRTDISHATNQTIIAGGASESVVVHFNAGNQLLWREDGLPGAITTQLFRDPTAWFHLLYSYDSDEGTAANRLQLFINGVEVTAWATAPQNIGSAEAWGITTNGQEITWGDGPNANTDLGAYLAQAFIIDGLSIQNGDYAVSDFIDTDANGNVIPVDLASAGITWGNNGSLLDFSDAAALGKDISTREVDIPLQLNSTFFTGSEYLNHTAMTDQADSKVGIFSAWIKVTTAPGGAEKFLHSATGGNVDLTINTNSKISFAFVGSITGVISTETIVIADGWTHILLAWNCATSTVVGYKNDVAMTFAAGTRTDANINYTNAVNVFMANTVGNAKFAGYVADYYWNEAEFLDFTVEGNRRKFIDANGDPVDLGSDGSTPTGTSPIAYFHRADNAAASTFANNLGSGGGTTENGTLIGGGAYPDANDFSTSGISANDQMSDSPTDDADNGIGNYCTFNPIGHGAVAHTFSNGNLGVDNASNEGVSGTMFVNSGKWYFELTPQGGTVDFLGIVGSRVVSSGDMLDTDPNTSGMAYGSAEVRIYYSNTGAKADDTSSSAYGDTWAGQVMGCAFDADAGTLWFSKAGTWQNSATIGEIAAGTTTNAAFTNLDMTDAWTVLVGNNADGVQTINTGQTAFTYTVPTGYTGWNTSHLPAPAVKDPSEGFVIVEDAEDNIAATLATARSGWTDYIDFIKDKSSSDSWIVRFSDDSTNHMKFDTNAAASTFPTLSGSNVHVGYSLRVGAAYGVFTDSVSHTNGTDTDTAHGLGSNNKWCLAKLESTTGSWYHKHPANSASKNNTIDVSGAEGTTFYVDVDGTNVTIQSAAPTGTYRVWVLEETSGLISLPQYTGNGSANGPYVSFGHTPHWLWRWGISVADNYYTNNAVTSPYNQTNHRFILDVAQAAGTDADIDILAGGYKVRQTTPNTSGTVYGCISFGSRPFGGEGVSQARAR